MWARYGADKERGVGWRRRVIGGEWEKGRKKKRGRTRGQNDKKTSRRRQRQTEKNRQK